VSRLKPGLLALLYALMIAYGSTIIGPAGMNYVPLDSTEALHRLLAMPLVNNDSSQRSDWMGNLLMLVPLGWLLGATFSPPFATRRNLSAPAAVFAFIVCVGFILVVKYAQLFFPPRTVTLNYVIAQTIGAAAGILLAGRLRSPLAKLSMELGRLESLLVALRIYTGLLLVFMLMPLDFALSVDDVMTQLDKIPNTLTYFAGEGRPPEVRIALLAASMIQTMPVGAMLSLLSRGRVYVGRSITAVTGIGFLIMFVVYAATTMVISGSASLPGVVTRTIGIALGAWAMHWLARRNPDRLRDDLADAVPLLVPVYLLTVLAANGLLSLNWTTPADASDQFYDLGLLPLFNYYIVTKAQAAKNIVGHVALYAPIGVMVWLRAYHGGGRVKSFVLATLLSAIVEIGRFLRPGLVPDINAVPLAGIAAWVAASLMPMLWQMLSAVASRRGIAPLATGPDATQPGVDRSDHEYDRRARRRQKSENAIGDIEDY